MAGNKVTWEIGLYDPDTYYVYRSDSSMDVNNLPTPLATLGKDTTFYIDTDGIVENNIYYYRVDAEKKGLYIPGYEVQHEVKYSTVNIHDVFGDGSIIATYQFNGDATDLGGNYDLSWNGTSDYGSSIVGGQSAQFNSATLSTGSIPTPSTFSASFWVKMNNVSSRQGYFAYGNVNVGTDYSRGRNWDVLLIQGTGTPNTNAIVTANFNTNEWHHIYVDSSENIYIDSVAMSYNGSNIDWSVTAVGLQIGEYTDYNTKLDGNIDQFRLFNRTLSQEEIDILYLEGT